MGDIIWENLGKGGGILSAMRVNLSSADIGKNQTDLKIYLSKEWNLPVGKGTEQETC